MKNCVYLDYNATAPARPEVLEIVSGVMSAPANASSVHRLGRAAHKIIEDAREKIAELIKLPSAQIIFNSGATEGNNTVLKFFSKEPVLVSAIEHPSVLESAPHADKIPVTPEGIVDLHALEKLLKKKNYALVSVMLVNNETGAIQPVTDISALAKKHGALFHCDAVQAAGRIAIDMRAGHMDFLTLSAHKIGGPQGVGVLAMGLCGITPTLLEGGGQEKKARAGTLNTAGIAGFGVAAELAENNLKDSLRLEGLRNYLENKLTHISPEIVIHAKDTPRVSNTTLFSLPGASAETLLIAFDLENICLSNGSACSSGTVGASHVLKAMKVAPDIARATLRVSTGWATTQSDIEKFLSVWEKIYSRVREKTKAHA